MFFKTIILLSLLSCGLSAESDKKWVWGANGRNGDASGSARNIGNEYLSNKPSPKYDVSELVEGVLSHVQIRPPDFRPPNDYIDRPYRPQTGPGISGFGRPGGVYNQGGFGPNNYGQSGYGQGGYNTGSGILTGPVPSWEREPPIKNYDRCKCTQKFNCNSPGISYGHCDVGKQYCCYNSHGNGLAGGPLPSRPNYSGQNGILVGPGGPVDHRPNGGYRPNHRPGYGSGNGFIGASGPSGYDRPNYGGSGVLVGPGGPTGIIGRPTGNGGFSQRPTLVGPGGPFDRPYGGYGGSGPSGFGLGRSASVKEDGKEDTKQN